MKISCFSKPLWSLFLALLLLPAAQAAAETVLIDFADYRHDRDGSTSRPYEYAFGDWNKHIVEVTGRGTLVQAPSGKGGLGENKTSLQLHKTPAIDLIFVIGNANKSAAVAFSIEDDDGTLETWDIPLAEQPSGQPLRLRLNLAKCDRVEKPGEKPGMNLKKLSTWQVKGNWSDPNVEVLLIKLVAAK